LWQVTGELVQKLEGHTGRVYAVNFHPSEPLLASASADHSIKVRRTPLLARSLARLPQFGAQN
jgi:WD40 repeat protein